MTFEWKITFISEETLVWQKQLPKISFVVEEESEKEFKNAILVDLLGEKTELIKQYNIWDHVKVYLNFRVSEFNWRHYNNIGAWKIEWWESSSTGGDDLPF
jgi:hypothetical protein